LVSVFQQSDPLSTGQADSVTARALLEQGADRITTELAATPELRARMQEVIAAAYRNLGLYTRAEPLALASLEARREAFGEADARTAESLRLLGGIRTDLGDFEAANEAFEEALTVQESLDAADPDRLRTLAGLSRANLFQGDHRGASEVAKELATGLTDALTGPSALSRDELWELLPILGYSGDWEASVKGYGRLVELEKERGGAISIAVANALHQMAVSQTRTQDPGAADSLFQSAYSIRSALSPTDVATGQLLYEFGEYSNSHGRHEQGDSLLQQSLRIFHANVDAPHLWIGQAEQALGLSAVESGRFAAAVPHFVQARYNFEGGPGAGARALVPIAIWRGGEAMWKAGRAAEGEAWLREAVAMFAANYSDDYLMTANTRRALGELLVRDGRGAEAYPVLEAALRVLSSRWGDENWRSDGVRVEMAHALIQMGRLDEARPIIESAIPRLEVEPGPDHPYLQRARQAAAALGS